MSAVTSARIGAMVVGTISHGLISELGAAARAPIQRRRLGRTVPLIDEDPLDPALIADAPAWWRSLHDRGPVHFCPRRAFWVISGRREVEKASQAHDVLSSAHGVIRTREKLPMMLTTDRPDHSRLRRLVARDFTNQRLSAMKPRVDELARSCLDEMLAGEVAEAYGQISSPLPLEIIADLLEIPHHDRVAFRAWSDQIVEAMSAGVGEHPLGRGAIRDYLAITSATTQLLVFFEQLIATRREQPGSDVLSALTRSQLEGGLTNRELLWFSFLLILAGNETTMSLISGLLLALATHPERFDELRGDPSLIPVAIEEGLRWTSPVQAFFREAKESYEVAGVTIPPRSRVMLAFGAANRDPSVYDDPDEFRLDRPEGTKHLAFGHGIHFCLGAHLARLEAAGVLEELARRVETIEPAGDVEWSRNPSLRQIKRLPLRIH